MRLEHIVAGNCLSEIAVEGSATRVLAYPEDVWYVPKNVKIGLRDQLQPILLMARTLEELRADTRAAQRETGGLLTGILTSSVSRDGVQTTGS